MTKRKGYRANVQRATRFDNVSSKPGVFSPTQSARQHVLQKIRQINDAVAADPPDVRALRKVREQGLSCSFDKSE